MFQLNIRLTNFLLAEYPDEYPAGWYLVAGAMVLLAIDHFLARCLWQKDAITADPKC